METQPLDFEKPIFELQRRLQDLKEHSKEHDVDLSRKSKRSSRRSVKPGVRFTAT